MNISLTPELERRISEKVESGLYTTASEVVRDALRLLFTSETRDQRRVRDWVAAEIVAALDEADRDELVDGDAAYEQVTETIERVRRGA